MNRLGDAHESTRRIVELLVMLYTDAGQPGKAEQWRAKLQTIRTVAASDRLDRWLVCSRSTSIPSRVGSGRAGHREFARKWLADRSRVV